MVNSYLISQNLSMADVSNIIAQLLYKNWKQKVKCLVLSSVEMMNFLDKYLWLFGGGDAFLAHGTYLSKFAKEQPILLTDKCDNVNNSDSIVLINVDVQDISCIKKFKKCYDILFVNDISDNNYLLYILKSRRDVYTDISYGNFNCFKYIDGLWQSINLV